MATLNKVLTISELHHWYSGAKDVTYLSELKPNEGYDSTITIKRRWEDDNGIMLYHHIMPVYENVYMWNTLIKPGVDIVGQLYEHNDFRHNPIVLNGFDNTYDWRDSIRRTLLYRIHLSKDINQIKFNISTLI